MLRCHKLPHDQKPSLQLWHDSPHAHWLQALQAFALDQADTADSALAIKLMQVGHYTSQIRACYKIHATVVLPYTHLHALSRVMLACTV